MAETPEGIVLERHRDLSGRYSVWWRRALLVLIGAFLVAALLDVFGQRPNGSRAASSAATLSVYAPSRIRGGLLFEARFHVTAHRDLKHAGSSATFTA